MSEQTSAEIASLAGRILENPKAHPIARQLAGAALSQYDTMHVTREAMQTLAARVLRNGSASADMRRLAGSVLTQSPKAPQPDRHPDDEAYTLGHYNQHRSIEAHSTGLPDDLPDC